MERWSSILLGILLIVMTLACNGGAQGLSDMNSDTDSLYADSIYALAANDSLELFEEEVLPESADELFNDFFFNYVSDERFRKGRTARGQETDSCAGVKELCVGDFYAVIYEREDELVLQKDTSLSEVVVERINLDGGVLESFNFKRFDGSWIMQGVDIANIQDTPNADFLSFYATFSSDSLARLDFINEPLRFVMSSEDDDGDDEIVDLTAAEWFEVSSDLPLPSREIININYGQTCISNNTKLLLVEGISNGLFMKYRFVKNGVKWMLVEVVV